MPTAKPSEAEFRAFTRYAGVIFEKIYCSGCGAEWHGHLPHVCPGEANTITLDVSEIYPICRGCSKPQVLPGFKDGQLCIRCMNIRYGRRT